MGHLTLSYPELFAILLFLSLLMWAPILGLPMPEGHLGERGRTI